MLGASQGGGELEKSKFQKKHDDFRNHEDLQNGSSLEKEAQQGRWFRKRKRQNLRSVCMG